VCCAAFVPLDFETVMFFPPFSIPICVPIFFFKVTSADLFFNRVPTPFGRPSFVFFFLWMLPLFFFFFPGYGSRKAGRAVSRFSDFLLSSS